MAQQSGGSYIQCSHHGPAATNPFRDVRAKSFPALVQLGGLEPPTSCSTDRRSNQLSYNCILASRTSGRPERAGHRGGWTGRKLGATAVFGKAANGRKTGVNRLQHEEIRPVGDHSGVALPSCGYSDTPREERALSGPLPQAGEVKKNPGRWARVS